MTREKAQAFIRELGDLSRKYNTRIILDGSRTDVDPTVGTITRSDLILPTGGYRAEYEEYDRFPEAGDLWNVRWDENAPDEGVLE